MSFFSDLRNDPLATIMDFGGDVFNYFQDSDEAKSVLYGALANQVLGDSPYANKPAVGYQGKVPNYAAVRQQIDYDDTNRRPGSQGRRYFTDTVYAKGPDEIELPTLEEARAQVAAQANQFGIAALPNTVAEPVITEPTVMPEPMVSTPASGVTNLLPVPERSSNPFNDPKDINKDGIITSADIPSSFSQGGIAGMQNSSVEAQRQAGSRGYYLGGATDGMADKVPARIDDGQEARLSDGEFVIPADVVSHLGNGNSDAGAKQLHSMMNNVRQARTGNPKQGKEIDPNKFMPKMAGGGIVTFSNGSTDPINTGATTGGSTTSSDPLAFEPQQVGVQSSLADWAGDYTVDALAKGKALADQGMEVYTGPLTAGESDLQGQAFTGISGLAAPNNMGAYTPQSLDASAVAQYMNPYLQASLNPQLDEARRQADISRQKTRGALTRAGAFGGSRQAIMESEGLRNLADQQAKITGEGYASAYDRALNQFNREQDFGLTTQQQANKYGLDVLGAKTKAGQVRRDIEAEGIAADKAQFEEQRLDPFKMVQFQKSLLAGLPVGAQQTEYTEPSSMQRTAGYADYISQFVNANPDLAKILGYGDSTVSQTELANNMGIDPSNVVIEGSNVEDTFGDEDQTGGFNTVRSGNTDTTIPTGGI